MRDASVGEPTGPSKHSYDVVIVGSGMGGGTLAYALADSGVDVLLIERGDFLPQEKQNWSPQEVFEGHRYANAEQWYDTEGRPFSPGTYYYVGGNTKLYGSSLVRFRREDFQSTQHEAGESPEWPFSYDDFAPYYARAEQVYRVHGDHTDDPTLPRDEPFPYPAIGHEPPVQEAADALRRLGYTPSNIPLGIDLREGGGCIRCRTCDGFPCRVLAKSDADVRCVRPAVASGTVELLTNAYAEQVLTDDTGMQATGVRLRHRGTELVVEAATVVVSCGAVNSAALLLRSANPAHPGGLANSSGMVGRNYMVHNNSIMVGINPLKKNTAEFQKTLYLNDFYTRGTAEHPYPLGHVQLIGKLQGEMIKGQRPLIPKWALSQATARSIDWWLFTEDLPDPDNRVTLTADGNIQIAWTPNNTRAHEVLVREMRKILRKIGYPFVFSEGTGIEVNSHQAGTVRAGTDPATSVLDADCRAHDVHNLYVVDSSFFPSLPVMNPALSIAANAFRVAEAITAQHRTTAGRTSPAEPTSV
ncbi:GMC family oxidoreductase [Rhodococcus koreensis]|uniref:Choline dehydrogenase n=1 Tax=Rhodococcus koreensis TaxID=99653 RepID=A0A1H4TGH2_9NOCA|nr:GMC family oxidoreductase [Rhodococcus koreensis]QSE82140.1 GMC family oxidoreductase [Rhodococcus koreensis]SEC55576.1 Choline dehydrogenase [Rhodococcus koreensis]